MPGVQRDGDPNGGGGIIVPGQGHQNVLVNGTPAARPFSAWTPHIGCDPEWPIHCIGTTLPGARSVLANGQPLIIDGNSDTCGHKRIMGSPNVRAV